jgi:hypothetical protein
MAVAGKQKARKGRFGNFYSANEKTGYVDIPIIKPTF